MEVRVKPYLQFKHTYFLLHYCFIFSSLYAFVRLGLHDNFLKICIHTLPVLPSSFSKPVLLLMLHCGKKFLGEKLENGWKVDNKSLIIIYYYTKLNYYGRENFVSFSSSK